MLTRCALIFDVSLDDIERSATARRSEVAGRPQGAFSVSLRQRRILLSEKARRHTLEAVDERRKRDLGRVICEQVNMIVLSIKLDNFRLEVGTDAAEYLTHCR